MNGAGLPYTKATDVLTSADMGAFLKYTKTHAQATKTDAKSETKETPGAGTKPNVDVETQRRDAVKQAQAEKRTKQQEAQKATANKTASPKTPSPARVATDKTSKEDDYAGKKRSSKRAPVMKNYGATANLNDLEDIVDTSKSSMVHKHHVQEPRVLKVDRRNQSFAQPTQKVVRTVQILDNENELTVANLAKQMAVKATDLVATLAKIGVSTDQEGSVDKDTAILVVAEMGHKHVVVARKSATDQLKSEQTGEMARRPAVVTVMGHVDHGKTSLLDYIRKSKVASGEHGGITQHIGAYRVEMSGGSISFIDTPGHAAFSAMRARGANCTDIVILVVAADDGVQPQTKEAIKHAKVANAPLVVAVNKMDLEQANPKKVEQELVALEVIPESLGGDIQFVEISALTGKGVDQLLEAVSLQADILDLKARSSGSASGVVLESRMDKGRGIIASLLIQHGVLRQSDVLIADKTICKVRRMSDESGNAVKEATPSMPVEVLGFDQIPDAGTQFAMVKNERAAREIIAERERERDQTQTSSTPKVDTAKMMEELMASADARELNIILRADTRGTMEAIKTSLEGLGDEKYSVRVLFAEVGAIHESDLYLASKDTLVVGFNVRASSQVRQQAERISVNIRYYNIIYELLEDVEKMLKDLAPPEIREEIIGIAQVRQVFTSPRFGKIAGCIVSEGKVQRGNPIRVLRDQVVIFEGELSSLRRFKEDVNEVRNGTECGIGVKNYNDVHPDDQIEVFQHVTEKAHA